MIERLFVIELNSKNVIPKLIEFPRQLVTPDKEEQRSDLQEVVRLS